MLFELIFRVVLILNFSRINQEDNIQNYRGNLIRRHESKGGTGKEGLNLSIAEYGVENNSRILNFAGKIKCCHFFYPANASSTHFLILSKSSGFSIYA